MIDNLRAMLAPVLVLIFLSGHDCSAGPGRVWTGLVLFFLGSLLTSMTRSALQIWAAKLPGDAFRPLGWNLLRWLLAVAFLPYELISPWMRS